MFVVTTNSFAKTKVGCQNKCPNFPPVRWGLNSEEADPLSPLAHNFGAQTFYPNCIRAGLSQLVQSSQHAINWALHTSFLCFPACFPIKLFRVINPLIIVYHSWFFFNTYLRFVASNYQFNFLWIDIFYEIRTF